MKQRTIFLILSAALALAAAYGGGEAEALFQSPLPTPTMIYTPTPSATPTATHTPTLTPSPTVGPPLLLPAATCGQIGAVVTVEAVNFSPNALASLTWSGLPLGTDPSPLQADPVGRLRFTFVVPNDYAGPHLVRVADGLRLAQFTFSLGEDCAPPPPTEMATPAASPTPTWTPTATATPPAELPRLRCEPEAAVPDTVIYVYGENFHPGGLFHQLRWDGVAIPWAPNGLTVGDDGKFMLWFATPSDTYELHTLVADDGRGSTAECYLDLLPRDPTPTWTPTASLTPTPTATWTPGPPPRITVTPTLEPSPFDFCVEADAVFSRNPLVDTLIDAGLVLTNTYTAWPENRLQLAIWQYDQLQAADTGVRFSLPGLPAGQALTLRQQFQVTRSAGPAWFQLRLVDQTTGQESICGSSPWFVLYVQDDEPYPPPLLEPADNIWLNRRDLTLAWLPAEIPPGAGPVDGYELHLLDRDGVSLLEQVIGPEVSGWSYPLAADYGERQLAWRVRAHNAAGWGRWATAFYFGVDTTAPAVNLSLAGTPGDDGWWLSPVTVRLGGADPFPGSGLAATYLQMGESRWQQVIPGGANSVDREGIYRLRVYGRDQALNRSPVVVEPVRIDLSPPYRVEAVFDRVATSSGWYTAPLTISLAAADEVSGVAERLARLDGGAWQPDGVTVGGEGIHPVEFKARDAAGHETGTRQTTAKLDLTPPAGAIALNGALCQVCPPITVSVAGGDAASGLAHWALRLELPVAWLGDKMAGLAAPLTPGDTVLASGSDGSRDILLKGGDLPVGPLTLRLAVQDTAGWVTAQELQVDNALYTAGPTPTPWLMATATPWPTPTPGVMPYVTITPTPGTPGSSVGGGGDDDGSGNGGSSSGSDDNSLDAPGRPLGYPVGGTVVPAILPVTGEGMEGGGWIADGRWWIVVFAVAGLAIPWLAGKG
ncbi:MAG: hypothetical protein KJ077_22030 [Anaerolineae bacterium]|nr:hypothetical protein [Anaerolineae bacterium]